MQILKNIISLCFLLICFNIVKAQNDSTQKINLKLSNVSLSKIVTSIEAEVDVHFFYDSAQLGNNFYSIDALNKPLHKILSELFSPYSIFYIFDNDKNIFLSKEPLLNLSLPVGYFTGQKNNPSNINASLINTEEISSTQETTEDKKIYIIGDKALAGNATINLAGYIKDGKTGEPIAGASVYIENPRIGVNTDQNGYFAISLPKGRQILNVQSLGIRDIKKQILLYSDGKLNINATISIMSLKKVTISSQKMSNVRGTVMGVQKLDIKTIKQIPVAFGEADVLRAVTMLPGVKTVGEASTGLNVRGGSSDQNLILFNDATIYNPSHFFGMFSAFNPELINNVELYKKIGRAHV